MVKQPGLWEMNTKRINKKRVFLAKIEVNYFLCIYFDLNDRFKHFNSGFYASLGTHSNQQKTYRDIF